MILLRHGQTMFNVVFGETRRDPGIHDPPLTEVGRSQAEASAAEIAGEDVTRIVSSPYTRALQTAQIVAGRLGVPIFVEPDVRERTAFACDIGTYASRLAVDWPALDFSGVEEIWWNQPQETVEDFYLRCASFRRAAAEAGDWRSTAVVTHWGVIRSLTGRRVGNGAAVRCDPAAPHPPLDEAWP